jgi:hypothetical protein
MDFDEESVADLDAVRAQLEVMERELDREIAARMRALRSHAPSTPERHRVLRRSDSDNVNCAKKGAAGTKRGRDDLIRASPPEQRTFSHMPSVKRRLQRGENAS